MKNTFINLFKKNKRLFQLAMVANLIKTSSFYKIDGSAKKFPKVIQLPITYNCNSRCVMCNIWKMDYSNEANIDEFANFMSDPIFKQVKSVGINGGEPSLKPNLPEYANEILKLPKIKGLNIISNGFSQKSLLKNLEEIYKLCREKGVIFHVSISIDGVGEIHNTIRGELNVFKKTTDTIDAIIKNQHKYCDSHDIGCTIVIQNIDYLIELDSFAKMKGYNIKYRLGIVNKRIGSKSLKDQYSVIDSSHRQSAKEFFHYQTSKSDNFQDKFKYFSIFYWLNANNPQRILGCAWKDDAITLDSMGKLYYCAVESESIGNLRNTNGETIFFNHDNIQYRKNIVENNCDNCIHDYNGKPYIIDLLIFLKHYIFERIWYKVYQIKLLWL